MKSILLVDDEFDARVTMELLLQIEGYAVITAENGAAALEVLVQRPVDLIITDWMMPVMGGDEFISQVRSDNLAPNVPIILMTSAYEAMAERAQQADYLFSKPTDIDRLLALVRELLQAKR